MPSINIKKITDFKINIKINFVKLIYFLVVFILLGIIIFISLFLYKNFYLTLNDVETVYELQNQVAIDNVDLRLFREVEEKINQKKINPLPDFNLISNPFK